MSAVYNKYAPIRRLINWLCMVLCGVALCGGIMAGVSAGTIVLRATLIVLLVLFLGRVIITVITTFEEV